MGFVGLLLCLEFYSPLFQQRSFTFISDLTLELLLLEDIFESIVINFELITVMFQFCLLLLERVYLCPELLKLLLIPLRALQFPPEPRNLPHLPLNIPHPLPQHAGQLLDPLPIPPNNLRMRTPHPLYFLLGPPLHLHQHPLQPHNLPLQSLHTPTRTLLVYLCLAFYEFHPFGEFQG